MSRDTAKSRVAQHLHPARTMHCRRARQITSASLTIAFSVAVQTAVAVGAIGEALATNQSTTPEIARTQLPWVVLTPTNSSFHGLLDPNGGCLGLLVSHSAALMAASCVQRYREATPSTSIDPVGIVAISPDETSAADAGDVALGSGGGWRLCNVTSMTLHPQYESDPLAYNVAVVQWRDPLAASSREPVLLDDANGFKAGDCIATVYGGTEIQVPLVSPLTSTCRQGGQYADVSWETSPTCPLGSGQQSGFVTRLAENRVVVYGLLATGWNCTESSSAFAPSRSHAAVSLLVNAREFLDKTSRGHAWLLRPMAPENASASGDTIVYPDFPAPPTNSSSKGDDSASAVGEPDVGDPEDPILPPWRVDLGSQYGYLSQHRDLPTEITEGGIAVLIAPRFALTRASWIRGSLDVQWVHLSSRTIRIQRVVSDLTAVQHDRLVVVELEEAVNVSVEIQTTLPPMHRDLEALTTSVFNEKAFSADEASYDSTGMLFITTSYHAFEDRAYCGLPPQDVSGGLVCLQSSERLGQSLAPFNKSFLFVNELLVGVSKGTSSTGSDLRVAQAYEPLGASPRVRSFLDDATKGTVVWNTEENVYATAAPDQFLLGDVVLYTNGSSLNQSLLPCGVVPITRRFYLTMASCIGSREVAWVRFVTSEEKGEPAPVGDSEKPAWLPIAAIAVQSVMVHPIYKARQSLAYDFAIIELTITNDKPGIATVRLMGDTLTPHARVVEHRIGSNGSENDASRVVDSALCSASTPTICVAAIDASARCTEPAGDRTKTYSLFHRVGSFALFVGFSMATNCAQHRPYSQVATILNFINAVVDAPPWGATTAENGITTPMPPLVNRPFVVGLRLTKSGQNFCGGSLIAPQFVLTAAHCVTDGLAAWVSVASSASSGLENAEPIPIDTTRTRVHPLYQTPFAYSHDAAILELAVPAYAPSIVLERMPDFSDGTAATMYGYGADSTTSGVLSPVMHARSLELLSHETCIHTLPNIDDGVVCALARSGLDACAGDSGSPLVVTDPASGTERLVGIVSAGYGCGLAGVPGLYTRVASIATFVDAYAVSPVWAGVGGRGREGGEAPSRASSSRPASPPPISMATGGGNTPPSPDEANDSGKQSQASKGESQLPLRDSSAAPCVSGPPPSSLPLSSDSFSNGFQSQILKTALPGGLVTAVTKAKLLTFLLGDNPSTYVAPTLLTALASPANAVTLFSSGDARRILLVLVTHDATPLNQRRDRFGKATPSSITSASDQHATRCTATASPTIASSEADRSRG